MQTPEANVFHKNCCNNKFKTKKKPEKQGNGGASNIRVSIRDD